MPMPASVQMQTGQLVIDPSFSVGISGHSDAQLQRAVERFLDNLRRQTGMPPLDMKVTDAAQAKLVVHSERESKAVQELGEDESYSLEISPAGAKLDAATPLGIMRGLADIPAIGANYFRRLRRAGNCDSRQTAFSLAWIDDRREPPLHSARCPEAQSGRHGSGEAERISLASLRQSGLPR